MFTFEAELRGHLGIFFSFALDAASVFHQQRSKRLNLSPDLLFHVALNLVAPAIEPASIDPADTTVSIRLQSLAPGFAAVAVAAEVHDAVLLHTQDLAFYADVDGAQGADELVHGLFEHGDVFAVAVVVASGHARVGLGRRVVLADALQRLGNGGQQAYYALRFGSNS